MARFALLYHSLLEQGKPAGHWDLMLEHGEALLTWRLAALPSAGGSLEAWRINDHRLVYLDYEGEISGGRGTVTRVDRGACRIVGLTDDRVEADVAGRNLVGRLQLARIEENRWLCTWLRSTETE